MGTPLSGFATQMRSTPRPAFPARRCGWNSRARASAQRSFSKVNGIRGTLVAVPGADPHMPYKVGGTIQIVSSITMLDTWLKYILGSGPSSSVLIL